MNGGTISGKADGVYNAEDGTFTMNVGTVSGAGCGVDNKGTFTMMDGTISRDGNDAIGVENKGTFTMEKGTIKSKGTGVNNQSGGEFTMKNGELNVGDLGVDNNGGKFTLEDGTINSKGTDGAGVFNLGTFYMKGGTISATRIGLSNGLEDKEKGIQKGAFTISGGTITDCEVGVYHKFGSGAIIGGTITKCKNGVEDYAELTLSGNLDISGNTECDLVLDNTNRRITIGEDGLGNTTPIDVGYLVDDSKFMENAYPFTLKYKASMKDKDPNLYFRSDVEGYNIDVDENGEATLLRNR